MAKRNTAPAKLARDCIKRHDEKWKEYEEKQTRSYAVYECWARALRNCELGFWFITSTIAHSIFGEHYAEARKLGLIKELPSKMVEIAKPHKVV